MSDEIKELTQAEMAALQLNDRQFAKFLMEKMSADGDSLSHATVINWRLHGKAPQTDFLQDMLCIYEPTDRRFLFALKMLALKSPHIWGFQGLVWRLPNALQKAG